MRIHNKCCHLYRSMAEFFRVFAYLLFSTFAKCRNRFTSEFKQDEQLLDPIKVIFWQQRKIHLFRILDLYYNTKRITFLNLGTYERGDEQRAENTERPGLCDLCPEAIFQ